MSSAQTRAFGSGSPSKRRKRLRRLAFRLVIIGVLIVAAYLGVTHYRARDYLSYFREHKGRLVSSVESPPEPRGDGAIHRVTLKNDRGLEVDAFVKIPRASAAPRAAIVTLGGFRGGVHALEYLEDTGDFIVLAMDYPYEGRRSKLSTWEILRQVPAMRRAALDTPSATMLGVDYLYQRPDVDRDRIVLIGGSLGALFAPAVAAADDRITALALLFGGGDLFTLIDANLPLPALVRRPVAWGLSAVVSPLEPLKYIGRVAPRPVFMLNSTGDPRIPAPCSRLLQTAAGEPKTVRWIDKGHVHVRDKNFRQDIIVAVQAWLADIGYVAAAEFSASFAETLPGTFGKEA
jgi:dienelactone hydrolase